MVPRGGSVKLAKIKELSGELSRKRPIEAIGEISGNVPPSSSGADRPIAAKPENPEFEPLEHSVYEGRLRLGRYVRIAPTSYAAFDAEDRSLGEFSRSSDAYAAIAGVSEGGVP
jgi:hypothetical protein